MINEEFDAVDLARERRWARARAWLIALGFAALAYGPTLVTKPGPYGVPNRAAMAFAFLGGMVLGVVVFVLAGCIGPPVRVGRGQHLLSGKTVAGWRTVDLDAIVSVRVRSSFRADMGSSSRLIVVDRDRARLGLEVVDIDAMNWVRYALLLSRGRSVRVSRDAYRYLGLDEDAERFDRCRDWGMLLQVGAMLIPFALYILVVAVAAAAGAL